MAEEITQPQAGGGNPMVYLVGAGPGDPGLITVRGKELLKQAEVVIYDYLASSKLLKFVPPRAEFIYAGKRGGVKHTHTQEEINRMLVDRALAGRRVVRLKGGDPFIFGRGGEEIEVLVEAGISFEVVPGVTSATAAATYAGIPITHRKYTSSVAFITGHEDPTKPDSNLDWEKLATGVGTIVVYMGIKNLAAITERLLRHGRNPRTPVAVVRWASTPEQRTVIGRLDNICDVVRDSGIKPPSVVIIGEVVNLRDSINWFEKRPLFGRRIVVTRTREQASELVNRLEEAGAACYEFPTIAIEPPESYESLDRELARISEYQWLVFTSINAVRFFFRRLFEQKKDSRVLYNLKVAAVGTATAEILASYGITVDFLPARFTGEGLAEGLTGMGVGGMKVLIPRAVKAREILPEKLEEAGARVTLVPVYRNVLPESNEGRDATRRLVEEIRAGRIDVVTFTSSSTVDNFVKMLEAGGADDAAGLLAGVTIAAIGPITAATAVAHGLGVQIQPDRHTIPGLVSGIIAWFKEKD